MKIYRLLATSLVVALNMGISSCGGDYKNKDNKERNTYFITDESERGKYGEGTYIKTESRYKDKDGNSWHRDNIFAPRKNESLMMIPIREEQRQENMHLKRTPMTKDMKKGMIEDMKKLKRFLTVIKSYSYMKAFKLLATSLLVALCTG